MKTVTLSVADRDAVTARALEAFSGQAQGAQVSFASVGTLWKILAPKRWDILKAMTGAGPLSIRKVARLVNRDIKAVHRDIHLLLDAGVIERADTGKVEFPYDRVHVDFMLDAA